MTPMPKRLSSKIVLVLLVTLLSLGSVFAQNDTIKLSSNPDFYAITLRSDIPIAENIMKALAPNVNKESTGDLMVMAAMKLLGTPYVAGTLEEGDEEDVRVYLSKTDCILFVETCMNLALTAKQKGDKANFEALAQNVRQSRYRNGNVRSYGDRIHYTTEWIRQGEKRGVVNDITLKIGGEVYDHPIYFMTKNYKLYKHLKDANLSDECCSEESENCTLSQATKDYNTIAKVEAELNQKPYTIIPQDKIKACEKLIKNGDVICYMSTTPGLDIAHVAMAYWRKDGKLGFIHASMAEMKVVIDKQSIDEYVKGRKGINGIKVIRVR